MGSRTRLLDSWIQCLVVRGSLRWFILCVFFGAGCGDETLQAVEPHLEVMPAALDFGEGCVNDDNLLDLTLENLGAGRLAVSAMEIRSGGEVFSVAFDGADILARKDLVVPINFVPTAPKAEYAGVLVIISNDPQNPELEVPLAGVGGIREIEVVPIAVDFGVVNEGLAPVRTVEIRNVGGDPLVISALTWTSTSVDLAPLDPLTTPLSIAAKTSTVVRIEYRPVDLGADEGVLRIESNDEDEPIVDVPVKARANLAPRAVAWICRKDAGEAGCALDRRAKSISAGVSEPLGLEGRDSFDPEGGPLTYQWQVTEMPGANPPLLFFDAEARAAGMTTGDVEIELVGRYLIRLLVTDDRGLSSFDTEESRVAIQPKDLAILLRWDLTTDADLHLVRPGGQPGDYGSGRVGTSTGSDCSAFNRSPNWGDPGSIVDNPSLERDVVTGRGPEVLSLDFPEDGVYGAYVHYCDSRNVNTNIHAYIEVYVRGELRHREPVMDGRRLLPGDLWAAVDITWDSVSGDVTVGPGSDVVESRPELCILQ